VRRIYVNELGVARTKSRDQRYTADRRSTVLLIIFMVITPLTRMAGGAGASAAEG